MTSPQLIPPELRNHFRSGTWIWSRNISPSLGAPNQIYLPETAAFRIWHNSTEPASASALILITADNWFTLSVNGNIVGSGTEWMNVQLYNVTLEPANNLFTIICTNEPGIPNSAGLLASIQVYSSDTANPTLFGTNASWRAAGNITSDVTSPAVDDIAWNLAVPVGTYGVEPWGDFFNLPTGLSSPSPKVVTASLSLPVATITSTPITSAPIHNTPPATPRPHSVVGTIIGATIGSIGIVFLIVLAVILYLKTKHQKAARKLEIIRKRTPASSLYTPRMIPGGAVRRNQQFPWYAEKYGYQAENVERVDGVNSPGSSEEKRDIPNIALHHDDVPTSAGPVVDMDWPTKARGVHF